MKDLLLNKYKIKLQLGEKFMSSEYYVENSMDGRNIIRVVNEDRKIYIGSRYSVERDINRFNENVNHINANTVIVAFGIACGEHIKEALKNLGDSNKIIIIEPSKEILNLFLNTEYSRIILQDKRVMLYDFDKKNIQDILSKNIENYQVDNIKVISFANYSTIFQEEFKELNKVLRKVAMNKRTGRDTISFFSQSFFQNFIKNLNNSAGYGVINSYKDMFKNKPSIIVSAGPSLEKNIHLLKEVQDKFVIICGARTLKALTNIGVTPDFVCAVDPQDITYTIMKNELNSNVPLVFMESANYKLVSEYKGSKILFSNEGMETYIKSIVGKEVDSLMQGGSVAHVCMGLSYYLGCNPIIFIGQDLAYTGDKFHAESTKAMENPGDVAVAEFEKNKEQWQNMSGQNIYVKDINGDLVRTSIILNSYKEEFEDLIEKCQGVTFINSTEGGAHINGAEVISLKEAIGKYSKGEFDKNINFMDIIKEDTIKDNLIDIENNLMNIKEACKKGIIYTDKMYLYYINQKKVNINKIFEELDKVDLVINDMQKIGIIAYLLAPYVETILNDEKYMEKLNESQMQTGRRVAKKSKALYEVILKAINEALQFIN